MKMMKRKKITYDKNNLKGCSFKKYIILFTHDSLICFSLKYSSFE